MLNGKPCFQVGPLDQGFWPDGIYTAPTDAALRYDIEMTKKLGFNMTRKHVKVEPSRWYYWADRLGLLVWQDMPSGNNRTPESRVQFETELRAARRNAPEPSLHHHVGGLQRRMGAVRHRAPRGHGQTARPVAAGQQRERLERTRRRAMSWISTHYPAPRAPEPESGRAIVLGEFGGLGLALPGHTWQKEHWGYQGMADAEAAPARQYEEFLDTVYSLRETTGLSAAVYTQITDVEVECNGLLTYDRKIVKAPADRIAEANRALRFTPGERGCSRASRHPSAGPL